MAFNPTEGRAEYLASSGQTDFSFNFRIFQTTDILVYQTPSGQDPDATDDLLTITTDYTVTIDSDNGGTVTLTTGAGADDAVTLQRNLEVNRLIEFQTRGDLTAQNLNDDQEYQTYLIADQKDRESRALTIDASAQNIDATVPSPIALNFLQWNAAGTQLQNVNSLQADGYLWTAADVYTKTEIDNNIYTKTEIDTMALLGTNNLFHAQDQKTSGTNGGTAIVGETIRTLNTVLTNTISGASIAANLITLPAGTYYVSGSTPATRSNNFKCFLWDNTLSANILTGTSGRVDTTDNTSGSSLLSGVITLATTTDLYLKDLRSATSSITDLGTAASGGYIEVYADIKFWKVA